MKKYEGGGFGYHTTLPTDSLTTFRNAIKDTYAMGLDVAKTKATELGQRIRKVCEAKGWKSVAQKGFESPTVVTMYCNDANMVAKFKGEGIQVAGGVPFKVGEPEGLLTVRIGLFGVEKLKNVDVAVKNFENALAKIVK